MVIIFRILLLLVPVIGLVLWLRWRAKKKAGDEIGEDDIKKLRQGLIGLVILLLVAAIGIRLTDTSGGTSGRYVPARVENGKTIPGHFVDDEPKEEAEEEKPKESNETSEDTPS